MLGHGAGSFLYDLSRKHGMDHLVLRSASGRARICACCPMGIQLVHTAYWTFIVVAGS